MAKGDIRNTRGLRERLSQVRLYMTLRIANGIRKASSAAVVGGTRFSSVAGCP